MFVRVRQRGVTLIELIMFIVIVSVAIAGILTVLNLTVRHSADPIVQKQAQALAEGLLEEVQLGLFAYCDGADPQVYYATTAANCTGGVADSFGPEAGETRPYDTVKDYVSALNTATAIDATDISGGIAGPTGYTATVELREMALGGVAAVNSLQIIVRVSGPGTVTATAEGFRLRTISR